MIRDRYRRPVGITALLAGLACVLLLPAAMGAAAKPTVVTVTAGKPSELAFKLSKTSLVPVGAVTFKVTNAGKIAHTFEVCLTATKTAANRCAGKSVKTGLLKPNGTATLSAKLTKKGTYEYLCTVAGHAAAGMKGLIGVGVKLAPAVTTATVNVSAGKPSELAFKLSKFSQIPVGTVAFKVTNAGKIAHTFAICLKPTTAAPNACVGTTKVTKLLQAGQSQTITVKLAKGTYEYICTFPGHAAAGMKGLLGVGTTVTSAQIAKAIKAAETTTTTGTTSTTGTTTTASTTTTTATTTTTVGDGCPNGLTIVTAGNTDNDQDENGQPSDGDGCI